MKNIEVKYEGCKTTATITGQHDLVVGVAYWNPEDPYDKQLGKQIAIGRARKQLAQLEASAVSTNQGAVTAVRDNGYDEAEERLLLQAAARSADRHGGLCFVHRSGERAADYVVVTTDRYRRLITKAFGEEGIPADDPEWEHDHVEPEMLRS